MCKDAPSAVVVSRACFPDLEVSDAVAGQSPVFPVAQCVPFSCCEHVSKLTSVSVGHAFPCLKAGVCFVGSPGLLVTN